jgi:hypothetical protein
MTLLAVVLIRSYSLGFGRHPNKDDPAPLWRIKAAWWTALSVSCVMPQLIGSFAIRYYPQPLALLVAMGLMMFVMILYETYASNKTSELVKRYFKVGNEADHVHSELTYLVGSPSTIHPDGDEECFLKVQAPRTEQDSE